MAKHRRLEISFPLGGLDRGRSYKQQPPYTTTEVQNMRPRDQYEGRLRGGSRPGLVKSHTTDIGGPIRFLYPMQLALGDSFTAWTDNFDGSSLSSAWTQASWASDVPLVLPSAMASIDYDTAAGAAVNTVLPIDATSSYSVEMYLVPWNGAWHGSYVLYLRMNDTTPDSTDEGVVITLTQTGTDGAYSASMETLIGGASTTTDTDSGTIAVKAGWLTADVSGDDVTVYWNGTQILTGTVDTQTGLRTGFGLACSVDGGICLVNTFRTQYYSTGSTPYTRTMLIASADGDLWREETYGTMTVVSSNLTVRSDVPLQVTQGGQNLYIADYGVDVTGTDGAVADTLLTATGVPDWTTGDVNQYDYVAVLSNATGTAVNGTYEIASVVAGTITLTSSAGTGNVSYRIERAPKVYTPETNVLALLVATTGQVPSGNRLCARFMDRLVLGGGDVAPNAWYMSRQAEYADWDYAEDDTQAAIAGPASDAGVPGLPLTAISTTSDDYTILSCKAQLYRMRGDPTYGGSLDSLSDSVGMVGEQAWCHGPAGELIFLSLDGIYIMPPGGSSYPISMSREILPRELLNIDTNVMDVSLEYDTQGRGVHVYLTPDSTNDRVHWWFDWDSKTYWNVTLQSDHEPTATCGMQSTRTEDSAILLGCRDGYIRRFHNLAANDDGTAYVAYVLMGPIALGQEGDVGNIVSMDAVLGSESGDVTWEVLVADTFEGVSVATASASGTWAAGLNPTDRPAGRGQAFAVKATGAAHNHFTIDSITATIRPAGKRRVR